MHKTIFTLTLLIAAATAAAAQSPATGQILGHDYVDLGLSVMWATCNIGAFSPSDYGDYFAWGEAETKAEYTVENSATQGKLSYTFLDAASVQWGSVWRMPSLTDVEELINGCNWDWTTIGGHEGLLGTGPNGNTIFLPAAGMYGTSLSDTDLGTYWTLTPCLGIDSIYAKCIEISFSDLKITTPGYIRFAGRSIRPVAKVLNEQEKKERSIGQISGHDYVDLGLSVMWATCNIGASSPSDIGDHFAWGEAETKSKYTSKNCATYLKTNYTFHDAAKKKWGGTWRMPTAYEYEELINNCDWTFTQQNNRYGYKVTSKINGNSIFLPAAGYRCHPLDKKYGYGSLNDTYGFYWSSTKGPSIYAYHLNFDKIQKVQKYHVDIQTTYKGYSIRPVSK